MSRSYLKAVFGALTVVVIPAGLGAQTASPCPTQTLRGVSDAGVTLTASADLVCLIPQVYGPGGLVGQDNGGPLKPTDGHEVHFQASSLQSFTPLNESIGVQLSQLPIAAPVAGYLFENGAVVTSTESLGPVLSDRADTLGRGRAFLGVSYQHFDFDRIGEVNLRSFSAVFTHEAEACTVPPSTDEEEICLNGKPRYTYDIIATHNNLSLKLNQVTILSTFGVTNNVDVSAVLPVLSIGMKLSSSASITNLPKNVPSDECSQEHTFVAGTDAASCLSQDFALPGSASGIGDIVLRVKYRAYHGEVSSFASGVDFRIPTGDAMNFLGAGTWGIRPFASYSARVRRISPHANVGFQGNGQSILAGDVTGANIAKAHLPDVLSYSGGADLTVHHRIGLSADFLGQTLFHGTRIRNYTYPGFTDPIPAEADSDHDISPQPSIRTDIATINQASVSAGIKVNPFSNLLITANGLFRVNDAGLHAKPAPLLGISYSF